MRGDQITIVVLNWKRPEETIACLESLARADLDGARVLVVDNGSGDGSPARIRARFPAQRIVELPVNRGYAGGNNAGIRIALDEGARGVLLLNNDTTVAPDFLLGLRWAMGAAPRVAAASSAILRHDNPEMLDVAYSEVRFEERSVVCLRGVNTPPGYGFDRRREVEVAVGCSVLLFADALREVGLLDEAYFAYHEDVDWCLRARAKGWTIWWEPLSRVYHGGSVTTRALAGPAPAAPPAVGYDRLLHESPPPWNPVRVYLGSRNVLRLLRTYATHEQRRAFYRMCVRELPLEFFAVVMGREGWMTLGRWSWRSLVRFWCLERHRRLAAWDRRPSTRPLAIAGAVLLAPVDLLWGLPRAIWRAWRRGRLRQFVEECRGLWDGFRDRPLPLARLGLA